MSLQELVIREFHQKDSDLNYRDFWHQAGSPKSEWYYSWISEDKGNSNKTAYNARTAYGAKCMSQEFSFAAHTLTQHHFFVLTRSQSVTKLTAITWQLKISVLLLSKVLCTVPRVYFKANISFFQNFCIQQNWFLIGPHSLNAHIKLITVIINK